MWILSIALPFRAISLQTDGFCLQLLVIVVRNIRILMFLYLNLSLFYFGTTMVTEPHVMAFLWLPEGPTPHLPACFREALSLSLLSGFPLSLWQLSSVTTGWPDVEPFMLALPEAAHPTRQSPSHYSPYRDSGQTAVSNRFFTLFCLCSQSSQPSGWRLLLL